MNKYLVDLYLPAAGIHLDVFLPGEKYIGEAIPLLVSAAESLSGGSYKGTADAMLLNAATGEPYDVNLTVEDAGIRNAAHLILI